MRRLFCLFPALSLLAFAAPAAAHVSGPILTGPTTGAVATFADLAQSGRPACRREIFEAGQYPASPLTVDSITCLDNSCDTRAIVLCPLTD